MRNSLIALVALSTFLPGAFCSAALAQQPLIPVDRLALPPPPPDPNEYRVTTEVDIVLLDVAVKDSNGGFVSNLEKDAFRIFDSNVEQPVSVFGAQDTPVTVGLVVDNSGSVRPIKPQIVTAALTFVTNSNPQDETFVVNFNDSVTFGLPDDVPFTDNLSLLRQALLTNPARGRTALYDAIKEALQHLGKGRLDKKTLVVVGDGGDNMSDTTRREILELAERSLATIYTVGIFNPQDKDKDPGFLRTLARITGGEAFAPRNVDGLVGVCEKIAHDIRNRYTVGFKVDPSQFDGKRRKLKVEVTGPDGRKLEARTRTFYVAEPREKLAKAGGAE